jgi:CheY-like chemotaxis protein
MNGILGFSQLLSDENLTPQERQSYISIINKNSQLLLRVISDIVDIAKIESNQLTISKTGFNLNKLLEGVYLTFRNEIKTSGKEQIGFTLKLGLPEEESNILSDNARVEQVLYNLLGNALKFTSQGSISFGYQKEEDILIFFVSDSGKGIAPEKQHIIFERFRQEEENYTRKFGGSGLGLSISKGLVELLGGKMWMTSIEGEGSTFFFRLPYIRIEASPSVSADSGRSPDPMDLSGRTILLVDDNIESFELIRTMLKGTKCSMLFAQNGQQSIDFCRNDSSISLVLMDIQMPVMNGYDATREIRKFRPTLPIVALTAYAFREDRIRSLDAGCNDILTKPVQKADLLSMIRKVLS